MITEHDIHPGACEPQPPFTDARAEIAREIKRRLELCPDTDRQHLAGDTRAAEPQSAHERF